MHPKPPWHQQKCRGWHLLFKGLAFLFLMCSQRGRKHFNSVFSKTAMKSIFFPLQYHLEGAHPYTPHPFWCLKELGADMPDFGLQWYRESRHLLCLCSDVMAPWVSPGLRKQAPWLDFVLVPLFKCQSTKQISPVIWPCCKFTCLTLKRPQLQVYSIQWKYLDCLPLTWTAPAG